jgi:hypothetical protein
MKDYEMRKIKELNISPDLSDKNLTKSIDCFNKIKNEELISAQRSLVN